jgi:hypothetical protein
MKKQEEQNIYQQRLQTFLGQIQSVERRKRKDDLYAIMDTPVFRDLETALMMATMESEARA